MNATASFSKVLSEIHRLRRHLRDLHAEVERLPRLLKAHQAKVAKSELTVKEAHDALKHLKVQNHDKEVNIKATSQLLTKYERQLNEMTTPKEIDAKHKEIASSKELIAKLEEEVLAGMAKVDERAGHIPALELALKKAKEEFAVFDKESKSRQTHLTGELKAVESELKQRESELPLVVKGTYERVVKAHGADALAPVAKNSCGHCHTSVTSQNVNELHQGRTLVCNSCGRMLYPTE